MGQQQLRTWRTGTEQTLWLSALIDAMEEVSRPELRAAPCDPFVLTALRAQLARPASGFGYYAPLTACGTEIFAYSPANCSRGCFRCSTPRSRASSRVM